MHLKLLAGAVEMGKKNATFSTCPTCTSSHRTTKLYSNQQES